MADLWFWLGRRIHNMIGMLVDWLLSLPGFLVPLMALGTPVAVLIGLGFLVFGPGDDPLFRRPQTPCPHPRPVGSIEITRQGFSYQGCVQGDTITIANRLPDHPITLCIGRRGRCLDGHSSPFGRNRLTIGPGKTAKDVTFPDDMHYLRTIPQYYPITVMAAAAWSPRSDLVIKGPAQPSLTPAT